MPRNADNLTNIGLCHPSYEYDGCGVGFICNISGKKNNQLLKDGLIMLNRLAHRGAVGADPKTGDGAGLLIQTPDLFLRKEADKAKISLPEYGKYGTGIIFLPKNKQSRQYCKQILKSIIEQEGQKLLGWRKVPIDNSCLGKTAKATEPVIEQIFISAADSIKEQIEFERILYIIRKKAENIIRNSPKEEKSFFYITNISSRTLIYKGLLMPEQLEKFYLDLQDNSILSSICLIHSRYSTNTFPTWDLAQPFRFLAHNGEINTLRGNINWMRARESLLKSNLLGQVQKILPIIVPGGSDSACLDNVLELLTLTGRSLAHAMMMLIPAAWENNSLMPKKMRDFYAYHACLMEPWDGPAAVAFTDGQQIGAVLDRNGLRPARYIITKDERLIMASEVGVLDVDPKNISYSGRLEPGKMLFVDTNKGKLIEDQEIKNRVISQKPYSKWLKKSMVSLAEIKYKKTTPKTNSAKPSLNYLVPLMNNFGYTREDLKFIILPMANSGKEPIGSMGCDIPHALLSKNPQLLYNYFKQLFAQVTNPAIDPIREEIVMSLQTFLGPEGNLLEENETHCHKIKLNSPILTNQAIEKIKQINYNGFSTQTISVLFSPPQKENFIKRLDDICQEAEKAVEKGKSFIVLTDQGVTKEKAALPMLLAISSIHHHLVKKSLRKRISIILQTAEPRETHHFALLFGYGADAINPYMIFDILYLLIANKQLTLPFSKACKNYIHAVEKGLLKILSKMGISTLQSYRGAQIFEALGLHPSLIERCFPGTISRIGGIDLEDLAWETLQRHYDAYSEKLDNKSTKLSFHILPSGGIYQWKRDGERHLWTPDTIALLQQATRKEDYSQYKEFAFLINNQDKQPVTLRSLLKFKKNKPIDIEKVEKEEEIVKRFVTGAMSFGSISQGAHESLAIAMNRLGGKSNTGEGGEDPIRFQPLPNGDSKCSAIKQVASGRFGVTTNYLVNGIELQIKIAQGAKPGEGGQLPGHKVSVVIAKTRYTTPGVTLISPPPHHDIYSIEDLAQLIFDLKNTNPLARISVKLVSEIGVGTIAAGVAKGHADMILISGGDGGTGASPLSSIRHAGLPWELGLSETHQTLVLHHLRSRVRLQTDGQMRTGRDVVIAALLGAEEFGFCTSALIVLGCVMLRHCHLNTCSLGVATQHPLLQRRFSGRPEYVVNYMRFVAREVREIMAQLGVRSLNELIGRTDLLDVNYSILPDKAKKINFSNLLYKPPVYSHKEVYCTRKQKHQIDNVLDKKLIQEAKPALEKQKPIKINLPIFNTNRTTGAMLSGEVCRRYGEQGLKNDTIHCCFKGIAGQSFGAWLTKGITFELEGMANDYVGKGISGGKIIIYPFKEADYKPEENIIIGNTTFYGAISGEAYIRGKAGERFCIRNSGLYAVVEGVGDHGCEYMTGGRVLILGKTGYNFAAGMSGGIAYIYNFDKKFKQRCNLNMVDLDSLEEEDIETITYLLRNHLHYTGSTIAKDILDDLTSKMKYFVKVFPKEYKRILQVKQIEKDLDLDNVS